LGENDASDHRLHRQPLDRADAVRPPRRLAALRARGGRLLRSRHDPLVEGGALVWGKVARRGGELVFLGVDAEGAAPLRRAAPRQRHAGSNLWEALASIPPPIWRSMGWRAPVGWHARHRFCARCGSPTVLAKGGWQRGCVNGLRRRISPHRSGGHHVGRA
jgi:NAD+ diphosphatase